MARETGDPCGPVNFDQVPFRVFEVEGKCDAMVERHLHWHAPAKDALVKSAEVRQRTDLEGGVLVGGVSEEHQVDRRVDRVAAEESALAEISCFRRDNLKAERVPIKFSERDRIPRAQGDVTDTDHLRRFRFLFEVMNSRRRFHFISDDIGDRQIAAITHQSDLIVPPMR